VARTLLESTNDNITCGRCTIVTARPAPPRLAAILHSAARARLAQFVALGSAISLPPNYSGGAPRIVMFAARDPITLADIANLAEIDLVEAWLDPATGAVKEQVVRRAAPPAGVATTCQTFTLNPASGPATFHAGTSFYDARVLQLPTNRWSVFDCVDRARC
jgi:hypothetical protein